MNNLPLPISNTHKLGFGCSSLGGSTDKKTSQRALAAAFANGICHFDVARSYGYGEAESIVGGFIKGKRSHVIITTKYGIAPPRPFPLMGAVKNMVRAVRKVSPGIVAKFTQQYGNKNAPAAEITPSALLGSLHKSLSELNTDYVDIYLLHNLPYHQATREDLIFELEKAKGAGKIRAWGATCKSDEDLQDFLSLGPPFDVVQFPYQHDQPLMQQENNSQTAKVIFSVMNQNVWAMPDPPPSFFKALAPNFIVPGLINNLREAWLFIAKQENPHAQMLCGMTKEEHIVRNLKILEAPPLSKGTLANMKKFVKAGKLTGEPVFSPDSLALLRQMGVAAA